MGVLWKALLILVSVFIITFVVSFLVALRRIKKGKIEKKPKQADNVTDIKEEK